MPIAIQQRKHALKILPINEPNVFNPNPDESKFRSHILKPKREENKQNSLIYFHQV